MNIKYCVYSDSSAVLMFDTMNGAVDYLEYLIKTNINFVLVGNMAIKPVVVDINNNIINVNQKVN